MNHVMIHDIRKEVQLYKQEISLTKSAKMNKNKVIPNVNEVTSKRNVCNLLKGEE